MLECKSNTMASRVHKDTAKQQGTSRVRVPTFLTLGLGRRSGKFFGQTNSSALSINKLDKWDARLIFSFETTRNTLEWLPSTISLPQPKNGVRGGLVAEPLVAYSAARFLKCFCKPYFASNSMFLFCTISSAFLQ